MVNVVGFKSGLWSTLISDKPNLMFKWFKWVVFTIEHLWISTEKAWSIVIPNTWNDSMVSFFPSVVKPIILHLNCKGDKTAKW